MRTAVTTKLARRQLMSASDSVGPPNWEPVPPQRVAVVVAGAGARGGYEAGVLSVLLPHLEAAGVVPTLFVGTSAGAINVALYAAVAHLPAVQQGPVVLDAWRRLHSGDVFRSPLVTGLGTASRWAGQLMRINGIRLTGLLDTSPLWRMANQAADWTQLRSNLDSGLTAVAEDQVPETLLCAPWSTSGQRTQRQVDEAVSALWR